MPGPRRDDERMPPLSPPPDRPNRESDRDAWERRDKQTNVREDFPPPGDDDDD